MKKSLSDFIYTTKRLELFTIKALKLESKLGESRRDFIVQVQDTLKDKRDELIEKLQTKTKVKYERLEDKLTTLLSRLEKEQADVSAKTTDTILSVGLAIFGAFFGRKRESISKGATALRKGQSVFKEKNDVKNVQNKITEMQSDMLYLQEELELQIAKIKEEISLENYEIKTLLIKPRRSDVVIKDFALLWER
jgi:hypothetical protein